MAHADDATKAWVSATPTVNADDNVSRWNLKYKYTLAVSGSDDYVHIFDSTIGRICVVSEMIPKPMENVRIPSDSPGNLFSH